MLLELCVQDMLELSGGIEDEKFKICRRLGLKSRSAVELGNNKQRFHQHQELRDSSKQCLTTSKQVYIWCTCREHSHAAKPSVGTFLSLIGSFRQRVRNRCRMQLICGKIYFFLDETDSD
jgi:hypothetical protein